MFSGAQAITRCGWLVLLLWPTLIWADREIHAAGNPQFEVVGMDLRSVNYIDALSRHIVQVATRYLDPDALEFPQRILVSLKPDSIADFAGDYQVRFGERGFVNLDLRWGASLRLLTACHGLSEALFVRYSILIHGEEGPKHLPDWPAKAIGTKAYLSLRPAQSGSLNQWLNLSATPGLSTLLTRKWEDSVRDSNGYVFLMAVERSGLAPRQIRSLMAQGLSGMAIEPGLTELLQSQEPGAAPLVLEDWWQDSLPSLFQAGEEWMETMATSRNWLGTLATFSVEGGTELNLKQIWDQRQDVAIRDLIEARYAILRVRILRINPAYFNAARSLGALFENLLEERPRHQYIHQLAVFLGDYEDAKALENQVNNVLSDAASKGIGQ